MLHAILGLILLLFLVFNADLFRRALGVPTRRRLRRTDVGPAASGKPVVPIARARSANVCPTAFVPSFEPFKPERKNNEWVEMKRNSKRSGRSSDLRRQGTPTRMGTAPLGIPTAISHFDSGRSFGPRSRSNGPRPSINLAFNGSTNPLNSTWVRNIFRTAPTSGSQDFRFPIPNVLYTLRSRGSVKK